MEVYKTKSGEVRYREEVRYADGSRESKSFLRKADAEIWKRQKEVEKYQLGAGIRPIRSMPLHEVADRWFSEKIDGHKKIKTIQNYRATIEANLKPTFGEMQVDRIRFDHIEKWIKEMDLLRLAPATVNRELTVLSSILKFGVEKNYLSRSPLEGRSLYRNVGPSKEEFYTETEIRSLLIRNRDHWIYPILFLAVHSGMRPSEMFGLRWDRVNFSTNQIEITRAFVRGVLQESTKNGKWRSFPMSSELRKMFELIRKESVSDFVFTTRNGRPFSSDHFQKRHFSKACARAEVRTLRFYALRHTFASQFMMNGGNQYDLMSLMGHTSAEMTKIYAHLSPEYLGRIAGRVDYGGFGGEDAPSLPHNEKRGSPLSLVSL